MLLVLMNICAQMSNCDRSRSVSAVPHEQFALKDYSSYIPGPIDSKLGSKYQSDCRSKIAKIFLI